MSAKWRPGDLERIKRRFRALPPLAQRYVTDAMVQGANEIVAAQKRAAPVDDGDLRDAIHWMWRKSTLALKQIAIRVWSPKVKYPHLVEFGTAPHKQGGRFKGTMHPGTKPQPFFFPTYRALKRRVTGRIKRSLKKAVQASKQS